MTLTTAEVVCRTGVTARQLQWWDETNLIVPDKSKRNRQYDLGHLLAVLLTTELSKRGVSTKRMRQIDPESLAREAINGGFRWAVIGGPTKEMPLFDTTQEVLRYLEHSGTFATCVDMTALREQAMRIMQEGGQAKAA